MEIDGRIERLRGFPEGRKARMVEEEAAGCAGDHGSNEMKFTH